MEITIHQTTVEDWKKLQELNYHSGTANAHADKYLKLDWVYEPAGETYFKEAAGDKKYTSFVALNVNEIIGYITLHPISFKYRKARTIEVHALAVDPNYRSKGTGAALVAHAKKWAKEQGYETMYVNSYIKNTRAVDFYKREGFEPLDISLELTL